MVHHPHSAAATTDLQFVPPRLLPLASPPLPPASPLAPLPATPASAGLSAGSHTIIHHLPVSRVVLQVVAVPRVLLEAPPMQLDISRPCTPACHLPAQGFLAGHHRDSFHLLGHLELCLGHRRALGLHRLLGLEGVKLAR